MEHPSPFRAWRTLVSWLLVAALSACSAGQPRRSFDGAVPPPTGLPTSIAASVEQQAPTPPRAAPVGSIAIATGDARETNFKIGDDLAKRVAPDAGIALEVLATKGSADNLHRLRDDAKVDLAIVQYDVVQAFVDEAKRGDKAASRIVAPLRIVTPLYTEEMYFVVRSDSTMRSIDEIKGKRINLGLPGSGSALTVAALYRRMFGASISSRNAHYLSDEQALSSLTLDKSIDVLVVVAGQPAKLFADMKSQARNYIKLLGVDEKAPGTREALKVYLPATIRARNYSTWLDRDVPTLSVLSFLVTSDRGGNALTPHLAAFARSLCDNIGKLRTDGHPKWREVRLGQQLGVGWTYDAASEGEFKRCATP